MVFCAEVALFAACVADTGALFAEDEAACAEVAAESCAVRAASRAFCVHSFNSSRNALSNIPAISGITDVVNVRLNVSHLCSFPYSLVAYT